MQQEQRQQLESGTWGNVLPPPPPPPLPPPPAPRPVWGARLETPDAKRATEDMGQSPEEATAAALVAAAAAAEAAAAAAAAAAEANRRAAVVKHAHTAAITLDDRQNKMAGRQTSDEGFIVSVIEPIEKDEVATRSISHMVMTKDMGREVRNATAAMARRSRSLTAEVAALEKTVPFVGAAPSRRSLVAATRCANLAAGEVLNLRVGSRRGSFADSRIGSGYSSRFGYRPGNFLGQHAGSRRGSRRDSRKWLPTERKPVERPRWGWVAYVLTIAKIGLAAGGIWVSIKAWRCYHKEASAYSLEVLGYFPLLAMSATVLSHGGLLYTYIHSSIASRPQGKCFSCAVGCYNAAWGMLIFATVISLGAENMECNYGYWGIAMPLVILCIAEAFTNWSWACSRQPVIDESDRMSYARDPC